MKIFHLSDLHIGLRLYNRDLQNDQRFILDQICSLAKEEQPDAVVIAGDIYDKAVPSAEAVELFDTFVRNLTEAVAQAHIMVISGNHDSAVRMNLFRGILNRHKLHMIGMPPQKPEDFIEMVSLQDRYGTVNFYLLPFVRPSMVKQIVGSDENDNLLSYDATLHRLIARESIDRAQRNVLVSHQFYLPAGTDAEGVERMDSEIHTVGNIDQVKSDILESFDYAALGHIHKPMKTGSDRYRYCGTPMAYSVSEAGQEKGILMVELEEKGKVSTTVLPLVPLHAVRVIAGRLEEVLGQSCEDYVRIVLTDASDLDMIDARDRIGYAFPNLLDICRQTPYREYYPQGIQGQEKLSPFELCCSFLGETEKEEEELLADVIHSIQGVKA